MPRVTKRLPVCRLHKPSGQARVRHGGREYWLGKFGSAEAAKAYAELISSLAAGREPSPVGTGQPTLHLLTIAELIERFWDHSKVYYRKAGKPTGEHVTIRAALRPLLHLFGREPAVDFGPAKLKLVMEEMIRLEWSRRYINDCVGRIKRLFNWAVENELAPAAVADAVARVTGLKEGRSMAREKPGVEAVPDEVVEATLPELPPVVADMVRIQRLTGHRPGELLAMAVEEIDRSDPDVWVHRPPHHKTEHQGKDRVIFIGPRSQAILAPHIVRAGRGRIFSYTRDGYREAVTRACDRLHPHPTLSRIPRRELTPAQRSELNAWHRPFRWFPNMLRHAAATEIRSRFGLDHAQVALGHACASTTEIYAKADADKARAVALAVG